MMKWSAYRVASRALLVGVFALASPVSAQVADSTLLHAPDLGLLRYASVCCVAHLPDGALIIGGSFSRINGQPRKNLAKILANGDLDPQWKPEPDNQVFSLAADRLGNVYVGGDFSRIGGQDRFNLAKLEVGGGGSADPGWPASNGGVFRPSHLVVSDDGASIYAGVRSGALLRKFSATGVVDPAWRPSLAGGALEDIALDSAGKLYLAGVIRQSGGGADRHLLRVDATGAGAIDAVWNPAPSSVVRALAVDAASDSLFVAGDFTAVGGQGRSYLARIGLSSTGAIDPTWAPDISHPVDTVGVADGHVFAAINEGVPGRGERQLARIDANTGMIDSAWTRTISGDLRTIAAMQGRPLALSGSFTRVAGDPSFNLALLHADTARPPTTFAVGHVGYVTAMTALADGSIVVGGDFRWAAGLPRANLLRLRPDRTIDPAWDPAPDNIVSDVESDGHDAVFVAGSFTAIGGINRAQLARIPVPGNGAADAQWDPALVEAGTSGGYVQSLFFDGGDRLYVSGVFNALPDEARRHLARITLTGVDAGRVDATWAPNMRGAATDFVLDASQRLYATTGNRVQRVSTEGAGAVDAHWAVVVDGTAWSLAIDPSQRLYVGGEFNSAGGELRSGLVRVGTGATAIIDTAWTPSADGPVYALAMAGDDRIYAGGRFGSISQTPAPWLARLRQSTGEVDATWQASIDGWWWGGVSDIIVAPGNTILVGGGFDTVDVSSRNGFAAFGDSIFADGLEAPATVY